MKFLFLFILLSSCGGGGSYTDTLREDSRSRICSFDQFIRVKQEFDVCKQTQYFTTYCYDLARVSYCSKRNSK